MFDIGIQDEKLAQAIEKALYAAKASLEESFVEFGLIDEQESMDNAVGIVVYGGDGIRIDLSEHGEIDIEIDCSRFQTAQQLDEQAELYGERFGAGFDQ